MPLCKLLAAGHPGMLAAQAACRLNINDIQGVDIQIAQTTFRMGQI